MKKVILPLVVMVASTPALASPLGRWKVADGSGVVLIHRCGKDLCGSTSEGKTILSAMRPAGKNQWTGTIIDVRDGSRYDGTISQTADDALNIHGCVQGGGPCGDQIWSRSR